MIPLIMFLYVILLSGLTIRFYKTSGIIELFPSLGWCVSMVVPFIIQWNYFSEITRSLHAAGIMLIAFVLLLGDLIMKNNLTKAKNVALDIRRIQYLQTILPFLTVISIVFHLIIIDKIPLVELTFGDRDFKKLGKLRNLFSRDAEISLMLIYWFNWIIPVFSVISISLLALQKKYLFAFLLFALSLVYSIASLASFPLYALLMSLAIVFLGLFYKKYGRYIFAICVSFALLILLCSTVNIYQYIQKKALLSHEVRQEMLNNWGISNANPLSTFSLNDYLRITPKWSYDEMHQRGEELSKLQYYLTYRWFFVPSEMAQRWYDYAYVNNNPFGYNDLLPWNRVRAGDKFKHPSEEVAMWSFYSRFPVQYPETTHGYSGIDADAYGRAGFLGWIVAVLGLIFLRLIPLMFITNHPLSMIFYYNIIAMLTLLPAHSSIQAILIAQGAFLPVVGLIYLKKARI